MAHRRARRLGGSGAPSGTGRSGPDGEFTGQSPQQRLGRGWLDVVHPGDREHACRQWREAVTQGRQIETQFRLWHAASREWRLTQIRARPLRNDDGSARGWVAMNIDLNALSQSEP
jgi:PAS domain S-box-containing protein